MEHVENFEVCHEFDSNHDGKIDLDEFYVLFDHLDEVIRTSADSAPDLLLDRSTAGGNSSSPSGTISGEFPLPGPTLGSDAHSLIVPRAVFMTRRVGLT